MINCFLSCGCGEVTLPALPECDELTIPPRLSQVCGLLLLPKGAEGPASWVLVSDVEAIIDNTDTSNSAGKWLVGRGSVGRPSEVVVELGKIHRQVSHRIYTLEYEVNIRENGVYAFLQTLQKNYTGFTFWYNTLGGRLFGGSAGIEPDFVTAWTEYSEEADALERGFIQIQWRADGDPLRTLATVDPYTSGGGGGSTPISEVMFYQQSFAAASSAVLTWTENSGTLPTTNTAAQILVFQEGQKLEETVQYTIAHATAPGESEITIDATTHYTGANYEVLAVITS